MVRKAQSWLKTIIQALPCILVLLHPLHLRAANIAFLPFSENFETGNLEGYWTATGTGQFRTQVRQSDGPHGGGFHLVMDDTTGDTICSRNELTLTINLAGRTNVALVFWAKIFSDEPDGPPTTGSTGGAEFDRGGISSAGKDGVEARARRVR